MKSSKLRDFTAGFAKFMEVFMWIGDALLVIVMITAIIMKDALLEMYSTDAAKLSLRTTVINAESITEANLMPLIIVGGIVALALISLTAIMFRNVNLIFKTTNQESPFAEINIKRIKNIGYIAISLPIIKLFSNIIIGFIARDVTIGVELSEVLFGLIILCLSQYFAYGASLEKDVNGLL
ncbi:DUF2975 domain-containing protein [Butyrivibrio sp. VCB2006]|uniref:DUF2975 domain-containing protein n=1 Tax=Butyrivibrio sp. VCB2006 TaxID=1280679 RepID=UPI0004207ABA|nr:DUF2975 domain-containing protein [Butyrivibrio sp. VCB2006]